MHGNDAGAEFNKISEITKILSDQANDLSKPYKTLIGYDAAVINFRDLKLNLFASDMMVENIHFRTSYLKAAEIGFKSMATNVSDMAAMGGFPRYATISLASPSKFDIKDFYEGVKAACLEYEFHIAGGDLSLSELTIVSIAMIGASYNQPIKRSTASLGDHIFVTGSLGGSAAGLELLQNDPGSTGPLIDIHKRPRARLQEARAMSMSGASSAIDVSDGLIADLNHICQESHLGAKLQDIPVTNGATLANALYGGEDYELVFSHPDPARVESAFASLDLAQPNRIGQFTSGNEITLQGRPLEIKGYQHGFI